MELRGIENAVKELKTAEYGRLFVNVETGEVLAMTYPDAGGTSFVGHDTIKHVTQYCRRFDEATAEWVRNEVEEYLHYNGYDI